MKGHSLPGPRSRLFAVVLALALWCGMMLGLEFGRRAGLAQIKAWGSEARSGTGVADGAVFGLLVLLTGFAFNGAAARYDKRRELVANEANALGTAWQRIETLPDDRQPEIRHLMRRYLDELIASYTARPDAVDPLHASASLTRTQDTLWSAAVVTCLAQRGEQARMLLLPGLNDAFGAVERERTARRIHPPLLVYAMLAVTQLAAAVFTGYALAETPTRNWVFIIGVATSIAFVTFVIVELEFPRLGLLRVGGMDQELVDLRQMMERSPRSAVDETERSSRPAA